MLLVISLATIVGGEMREQHEAGTVEHGDHSNHEMRHEQTRFTDNYVAAASTPELDVEASDETNPWEQLKKRTKGEGARQHKKRTKNHKEHHEHKHGPHHHHQEADDERDSSDHSGATQIEAEAIDIAVEGDVDKIDADAIDDNQESTNFETIEAMNQKAKKRAAAVP